MKKTMTFGRTAAFALPLIMAGGIAAAGGLSAPIETVAPTPVAAPAPAPMRGSDWTGFYAGAQLGYGELEADAGVLTPSDPNGAIYGVHAGYMYDLGSIVLGAELDFDGTNIDVDTPALELDSIFRAKLRVGYDAGAFLPYLTAGYVEAETSGATNGTTDGDFYGIGFAYKMNNNLLVGAEVLQHDFDGGVLGGANLEATTATARVSYKF
ncbi:outer membrane beta-barrel protein [Yoonia sp.]|uniref:outer membrane protein n=1 Tax=Yoonia sp. TaxID=2212373 RepID=UPI001A0FA5F5|nr:outer membrane beta-barrel protein [Yoonia sp.]MBE0414586.1 porin family protein [Yoonia sp.]